jgi:hypothetical protein
MSGEKKEDEKKDEILSEKTDSSKGLQKKSAIIEKVDEEADVEADVEAGWDEENQKFEVGGTEEKNEVVYGGTAEGAKSNQINQINQNDQNNDMNLNPVALGANRALARNNLQNNLQNCCTHSICQGLRSVGRFIAGALAGVGRGLIHLAFALVSSAVVGSVAVV